MTAKVIDLAETIPLTSLSVPQVRELLRRRSGHGTNLLDGMTPELNAVVKEVIARLNKLPANEAWRVAAIVERTFSLFKGIQDLELA